LNASWESKNDKNPKVVGFQLQKKSIFDEIKKLREKIKETRKEWDDRWYKFEDQTRLLKYIEDALSKISRLKKTSRKRKKEKRKRKMLKVMRSTQKQLLKKKKNLMLMKYLLQNG